MPHRIHHRHHVACAFHRTGREPMTRAVQNDRCGNARQPLGFEPLLRNLTVGDVAGLGSLRGKDPSFVHALLARHECYVDALGERDVTPGFSGLATWVEDQPLSQWMFSQRMRKISPGRRPESSMINSTVRNGSQPTRDFLPFPVRREPPVTASSRCSIHGSINSSRPCSSTSLTIGTVESSCHSCAFFSMRRSVRRALLVFAADDPSIVKA